MAATQRGPRSVGLQRRMRRAARRAVHAMGERLFLALVEDARADRSELLRREARRTALEIVEACDRGLMAARPGDRDIPARRTHGSLVNAALEVAVDCGEPALTCPAPERIRRLFREAIDEAMPAAATAAAEDAGDDVDAKGKAIGLALRNASACAALEIRDVARRAPAHQRAEADRVARAAIVVLGRLGGWLEPLNAGEGVDADLRRPSANRAGPF